MFARPSNRSGRTTGPPIGARFAERPLVAKATYQVLRLSRKATYGAIARGDKAAAVRYSAIALRRVPNHPFAVRLHVQALVAAPPTPDDCERAVELLGPMMLSDPKNQTLHGLWNTATDAMRLAGVPASRVASHMVALIDALPAVGVERAGKAVERDLTFGRVDLADELLSRLRDVPQTRVVVALRHRIATMLGEVGRAEKIAIVAASEPWMTDEESCHLAVDRAMVDQHPERAVERLLALRPQRDSRYSVQLVSALRAIGRHDRVLEYLDTTRHGLTEVATEYRYDALLAVGDLAAAHRLASSIDPGRLGDARALRIRLDDAQRSGGDALDVLATDLRDFETGHEPSIHHITAVLGGYFELGLLGDMERIEDSAPSDRLSASSRLHLARMHYCRRDFGRAEEVLATMVGSDDRWDAEKLRARILLETGHAADAVERRFEHTGAGNDDLDEVLYHGLLKEHRFRDAFLLFSSRREQRRLKASFGDRAEVGVDLGAARRRFVISQAGPGDEITAAGLYAPLRALSDELCVTCDPRLESVLSRSFPDITFVPVDRLRLRSASFLAPGQPARAENGLFDLMTADAMDVASSCDRVVMSKSMQHLAIETPGCRPFSGYLVPDPRLAADIALRWGAAPKRVGVVWRSELRSPMRDIHYLNVGDLAPLLRMDATFVSLQHDATDDEREELKRLTDGRVHFADDIDLRDDFESAAALSVGLSAIVGVGTTALELAAAAGVPGVMLQPTHFGTWRAMDDDGHDFWHRSLRVAQCAEPWDRPSLVDAGRDLLHDMLMTDH